MDVGLGPRRAEIRAHPQRGVLILVLVDVGLGPVGMSPRTKGTVGLNPCFSGCWSRTLSLPLADDEQRAVLILVLVDVGLGHCTSCSTCWRLSVLILVLVDVGLGHPVSGLWDWTKEVVLILVLVDVGLGPAMRTFHTRNFALS